MCKGGATIEIKRSEEMCFTVNAVLIAEYKSSFC